MSKPYPGIPAGILDEDLEKHMSDRNRKAIISEDGEMITFMHEGREWTARPSKFVAGPCWLVQGPDGLKGFGLDLWAAIDDALFYVGIKGERA